MLHTKTKSPLTGNWILGSLDRLEEGVASGWAFDLKKPNDAMRLHVVIDSCEVAQVTANLLRADVRQSAPHPSGLIGFEFTIPEHFWDNKNHFISFRAPGGAAVPCFDSGHGGSPADGSWFQLRRLPKIEGYVDGLRIGQMHGWAVRTEPGTTEQRGACDILITCQGAPIGITRADRYRGDVAAVTGGDPNCGFQFTIPTEFRTSGMQTFSFEVWPERIELQGSPLQTSVVENALELSLVQLTEKLAAISGALTQLKREVMDLLPQPGYCIPRYDDWARAYQPALRRRARAQRATEQAASNVIKKPLISVIILICLPDLVNFKAAVESVLAQTYANWELVIAGGFGRDLELSLLLRSFCDRDKRIRTLPQRNDGNASELSNRAVKTVRGKYVTFLNHDDLMFDEALDIMVRSIRRTGAKMVYSDEDKIDQAGHFSEPNFKPDWNYRYVLGTNYVSSLMLVHRDLLIASGPVQTKYDGAQDHALVLKLSEILSSNEIHHVPEVLYHSRKTRSVAASDISRKSYAVDAGAFAVGDHLKRRRIPAKVCGFQGMTLYNPQWACQQSPSVCVIIPFREQIDLTRSCLQIVLDKTDYPNFEVILVDNWSLSAEASEFAAQAIGHEHVRVLRIEEPFNFSRLNNLAVTETTAEFILFMNNDLFPSDALWLRHLVNEMLVDSQVAAVGGRLVYPNGPIQHAGVVVGPSGLAMHLHRGASQTDYGYIGRLILSCEVTAVTAACMLVRALVFREIGGFDEVAFKVTFNDIDLCLKIRHAGHKIIYCSNCVAVHHESLSRGSDDHPSRQPRLADEQHAFVERWGKHPLFLHDPAYNPHLTVDRQPFYDLADPNRLTIDL